jgi:hypothetical protein
MDPRPFLNREWEQVILAQDLRTEQEYLTASRAGQGTPLGKPQCRQVWALQRRTGTRQQGCGVGRPVGSDFSRLKYT